MHPFTYPDDALLYHGQPLRCLKNYGIQYDGGWGQIIAPPLSELAGPRSDTGWILPTAVLDACVVCCGSFVFLQFGGILEVPHGFELIRWAKQPRMRAKSASPASGFVLAKPATAYSTSRSTVKTVLLFLRLPVIAPFVSEEKPHDRLRTMRPPLCAVYGFGT